MESTAFQIFMEAKVSNSIGDVGLIRWNGNGQN